MILLPGASRSSWRLLFEKLVTMRRLVVAPTLTALETQAGLLMALV
jgi:hypothetical protein